VAASRDGTAGDRVDAAMRAVPRRRFLPPAQRLLAAADRPLPLMHGMTSSQPSTVAAMLRLLDARPGQRVLDVGAGSGWTTALLAHLTGPDGDVTGVEIEPELAAWGARNLADHLGRSRDAAAARLLAAEPDVLGAPDRGPFDRILVSAMATALPQPLVDQLAPAGVLVVPVQGVMRRVERTPDGVRSSDHGAYRFVPLRGARHAPEDDDA
jgi:protein-L-isoaspartate(D-aspartate) O-methyltransferase